LLAGSHRSNILARLPSFGGPESYVDTDGEDAPASNHILNQMRAGRFGGNEEERPETPRGNTHVEAPTDTVIAQHVQSIQVPETIARDFRARNRSLSPEKQRPSSSGVHGTTNFQGVPRRTLTLKEQNSKIDKLTKENFDLKLKIHFLDQALQSRSEEGVKELIDKNVQFQTDLANERKDSQNLRRKVRELERKVKEQEDNIAQLNLQQEEERKKGRDADDDDPTLQAEMHEEILYLRQQLDHSENKVTTLQEEVLTKEFEKRKMAEHMRSMAGQRGEDTAGMKETMDMWQDLLNAETGRREQAEEDIRKLREELTNLRIERASPAPAKLAKTRNLADYEESIAADSEYANGIDGLNGESTAAVVEQLKHENAELRRDLGAQTSMLTSRNRERERLQQEIEDLKLIQRKSDGARSVAGDSIDFSCASTGAIEG
jgi:DNA repair exonuclease SbcCD ATPase subunit